MESNETALEEARKKLDQTLEEIKKTEGLYHNVVIYLTDKDGHALVKGAMEYSNILALEKLHGAYSAEIIGMLFTTLQAELKQKYDESNQENTEENTNTQD